MVIIKHVISFELANVRQVVVDFYVDDKGKCLCVISSILSLYQINLETSQA